MLCYNNCEAQGWLDGSLGGENWFVLNKSWRDTITYITYITNSPLPVGWCLVCHYTSRQIFWKQWVCRTQTPIAFSFDTLPSTCYFEKQQHTGYIDLWNVTNRVGRDQKKSNDFQEVERIKTDLQPVMAAKPTKIENNMPSTTLHNLTCWSQSNK